MRADMAVDCVCVCGEQLPFPPDYLAPSAERVRKERKPKPPKQRKESAGKVRARDNERKRGQEV